MPLTLSAAVVLLLWTGQPPDGPALLPTVPQEDAREAGRRLLQRAQDAMGGAERLAAVRDTTHAMSIRLEPSAGGYVLRQVSQYIRSNHFRQEQETPFGKIVVYSDGQTGWVGTPQGTESALPDIISAVRGVMFRQPVALMLSDRDPSRTVRRLEDDTIEISSPDGQRVEIAFNTDTGLPHQQSYSFVRPDGTRVARRETLTDWREVDGIRLPFRATQFEDGLKVLEIDVLEYRINAGLTPAELGAR